MDAQELENEIMPKPQGLNLSNEISQVKDATLGSFLGKSKETDKIQELLFDRDEEFERQVLLDNVLSPKTVTHKDDLLAL
jgi:hypothetical protein